MYAIRAGDRLNELVNHEFYFCLTSIICPICFLHHLYFMLYCISLYIHYYHESHLFYCHSPLAQSYIYQQLCIRSKLPIPHNGIRRQFCILQRYFHFNGSFSHSLLFYIVKCWPERMMKTRFAYMLHVADTMKLNVKWIIVNVGIDLFFHFGVWWMPARPFQSIAK